MKTGNTSLLLQLEEYISADRALNVARRPVELAPFIESQLSKLRDLAGACSGGKFVVSRPGGAYSAKARGQMGNSG